MIDIWPREKLDLHVTQRLREHVDIALTWDVDQENVLTPFLRENGEQAVWKTIQTAIEDAGWHLVKKNPFIEDTILKLMNNAKTGTPTIRESSENLIPGYQPDY